MATQHTSRVKNAAKTMAFGSLDILKSVMPNMGTTVSTAKESAQEVKTFIRTFSPTLRTQTNALNSSQFGRQTMNLYRDAMNDIKQGNFSMDKLSDNIANLMEKPEENLDLAMGDNQDSKANGVGSGFQPDRTAILSTAASIESMKNVAQTISKTQLASAKMMSDRSANISMMSINNMVNGFNGVNQRLDTINKNIVSMIQFQNQNVSITNQATMRYMDATVYSLNEMNSRLSSLDKISDVMEKLEKTLSVRKEDSYFKKDDKSFAANGIDFHGYKDFIKKNLSNSMLGAGVGMAKTLGSMSSMANDPLMMPRMIAQMLIEMAIPGKIKKPLQNLDKHIGNYVKNALYRVGDMGDDYSGSWMKQMFGSIFGMKREKLRSVSLGTYNKDAMQWNGLAQKALTEVIPSQLSELISIVGKKEKSHFDYQSGKFMKQKSIISKYNEDTDFQSQMAFQDASDNLQKALAKNQNLTQTQLDAIQKNVNSLVSKRVNGDMSYGGEYQKQLDKTLGQVLTKNDFRDVTLGFEESIENLVKGLNDQRRNYAEDPQMAVYRNLFNEMDGNLVDLNKKLDIFSNNSTFRDWAKYGRGTDEDVASRKQQDTIKKEAKSAVGKKIKAATSRFKRPNMKGASDAYNGMVNGVDNFAFKRVMGMNQSSIDHDAKNAVHLMSEEEKRSKKDDMRNVGSSAEAARKRRQKQKSNINSNVSSAIPLPSSYEPSYASSRADSDANTASINFNNDATAEAVKEQTRSLKDMIFGQFGAFFKPMVGGIFGKSGILRSLFSDDKVNKFLTSLKDKLFDEKTGIFKDVTKHFYDIGDYIKYVFTGKGYTNRYGKSYKENDNNVGTYLKKGYQSLFSNTMKYLFADDFENNPTYKKYFAWMNLNKKKPSATNETKNTTKAQTVNNRNANSVDTSSKKSKSELSLLGLPSSAHQKPYNENTSTIELSDTLDNTRNKKNESGKLQSTVTQNVVKASEDVALKIKTSGDELSTSLFGNEEKPAEQKKGFFDKFKSLLPKTLAAGIAGAGFTALTGGQLGLIGSLFLPSGNFGGAIVGAGLSLLSKTEAFQRVVFGEKDDTTGERAGGIISKDMRASFKKHLPLIVGGGVVGALRKTIFGGGIISKTPLGIMMNTLLPGGPIGGAIIGMATSLLWKNEKFQKVLFGTKDDDGKRSGGILSNGLNKFNSGMKKSWKFAKGGLKGLGLGALTGTVVGHMGILGAAATMGGPVGTAVAGLALGIASQTKRFQTMLFGSEKLDANGNPTGQRNKDGLLNRLTNVITMRVFDPIQKATHDTVVNFAYWAKDKIMYPFKIAFGPVIASLTTLKDDIADFVKDKFELLSKGVGEMFRGFFKKIFSPITTLVGKIGSGIVKSIGTAARISLFPLEAAANIASAITAPGRAAKKVGFYKDYLKGNAQVLQEKWESENQQSQGPLGKVKSIFGKAKDIASVFNGKNIHDAKVVTSEADPAMKFLVPEEDKKSNKIKWDLEKKNQHRWDKIDKLRVAYGKEDNNNELPWTQAKYKKRKEAFAKLGINTGLDNEDDVKNLIFHKNAWQKSYDTFDKDIENKGKLGNERTGIAGVAENAEQAKARKKTTEFQDITQGRLTGIYEILWNLANERATKRGMGKFNKDSDSHYKYAKRNLKKHGLNPEDYGFDDAMNYADLTDDEWDNFRHSSYGESGDVEGWYKEYKQRMSGETPSDKAKEKGWTDFNSAVFSGKNGEYHSGPHNSSVSTTQTDVSNDNPYTPSRQAANTSSTADQADAIIDRLDSLNEGIYGSTKLYDRKKRIGKNLGKYMPNKAIDAAHTSPDEIAGAESRINSGILSTFFANKKKQDAKSADKTEESNETDAADSLGNKKTTSALALLSAGTSATSDDTTTKKTSVFSRLASGALGLVSNLFGGVGSLFSGSSFLKTAGIATLIATIFNEPIKKYLPSIVSSVAGFITKNIPSLLTNAAAVMQKYGPTVINSAADVLKYLAPSLLTNGWKILSTYASTAAGIIGQGLGIGNTTQSLTEAEAKSYKEQGYNVIQNADGSYSMSTSRTAVDTNGNYTNVQQSNLGYDALRTGVNSLAKQSTAETAGAAVGKTFGGKAGAAAGKVAGSGFNKVGQSIFNWATKRTEAVKATKAAATVASGTAEAVSGSATTKSKSRILDWIDKLFGKLGAHATDAATNEVLSGVGGQNAFAKVITTIKNYCLKAIDRVGDSGLKTMAAKLANGSASMIAGLAKVAVPVLNIYSLVNGALTAANLFGVDESQVDPLMRIVSSVISLLLGLAWGPLLDILLDIVSGIVNVDCKQEIASAIYDILIPAFDLFGGDSAKSIQKLTDSQISSKVETQNYNTANGTNTSTNAYLTLKNPDLWTKFWNWAKGGKQVDYSQYAATDTEIADYKKNQANIASLDNSSSDTSSNSSTTKSGSTLSNIANSASNLLSTTNGSTTTSNTTYAPSNSSELRNMGYGPGPKVKRRKNAVGYGSGSSFAQNDPKWANYKIGTMPDGSASTMGNGGCGPTALSNVASSLKKNSVDPMSVAKFAKSRGYIAQGGSTADLFTKGAQEMGLNATSVSKSSVAKQLAAGKPVILSGRSSIGNGGIKTGASPYTSAGHIISARGLDSQGNTYVSDPQIGTTQKMNVASLTNGMTNGWAYNTHGVGYGEGFKNIVRGPVGYGIWDSIVGAAKNVGNFISSGLNSVGSFGKKTVTPAQTFGTKTSNPVFSSTSIKSSNNKLTLPATLQANINAVSATNSESLWDKYTTIRGKIITATVVRGFASQDTDNMHNIDNMSTDQVLLAYEITRKNNIKWRNKDLYNDLRYRVMQIASHGFSQPKDLLDAVNSAKNATDKKKAQDNLKTFSVYSAANKSKAIQLLSLTPTISKAQSTFITPATLSSFIGTLVGNSGNSLLALKNAPITAAGASLAQRAVLKTVYANPSLLNDYQYLDSLDNSTLALIMNDMGNHGYNRNQYPKLKNTLSERIFRVVYAPIANDPSAPPTDPEKISYFDPKSVKTMQQQAQDKSDIDEFNKSLPEWQYNSEKDLARRYGSIYYSQLDKNWATKPWAGTSVGVDGGDITSTAMALSTLSGRKLSPDYIMDEWFKQYPEWVANNTISDNAFKDGGMNAMKEAYGVDGERLAINPIKSNDQMLAELKLKHPVMMTGYQYNGSIFGGNTPLSSVKSSNKKHSVLATYSNGKYIAVNDPKVNPATPNTFMKTSALSDKPGNGTFASNPWTRAYSFGLRKGGDGATGWDDVSTDLNSWEVRAAQYAKPEDSPFGYLGSTITNFTNIVGNEIKSLFSGKKYTSIFSKQWGSNVTSGMDDAGLAAKSAAESKSSYGDGSDLTGTATANSNAIKTAASNPEYGNMFAWKSYTGDGKDRYADPFLKRSMYVDKFKTSTTSNDGFSGQNAVGASGGDHLGVVAANFESSGNPASISGGEGDYGGSSFGTYQLASFGKTTSSSSSPLSRFWNKYYASKHPGINPGNNAAFKQAWVQEAKSDPNGFQSNEQSFMVGNYYKPLEDKLAGELDPDTHSRAAQESVFSTAIQYGPYTSVLANALGEVNNQGLSPTSLVNKIQDYKSSSVGSYFSGSSEQVRNAVKNRNNVRERTALLALGNQAPLKLSGYGSGPIGYGSGPVGYGTTTSTTSTDTNSMMDLLGIRDEQSSSSYNSLENTLSGVGKILGYQSLAAYSGKTYAQVKADKDAANKSTTDSSSNVSSTGTSASTTSTIQAATKNKKLTDANSWWETVLGTGTKITSGFYENRGGTIHGGIDYSRAGITGTPIPSPIGGTVDYAGPQNSNNIKDGFGYYVRLKDPIGDYHYFGHMNSTPSVAKGATVQRGSVLGYVGSTGNSTGPHLHYEIRKSLANSSHIDPESYTFPVPEGYGLAMGYGRGMQSAFPTSTPASFGTSKTRGIDSIANHMGKTKSTLGTGGGSGEDTSYYGTGVTSASDVLKNLNVAVNTTGVENKIDALIQVAKCILAKDYGTGATITSQTTNNNAIGYGTGKSATPVIVKSSSNNDSVSAQPNDLRSIHELMGRGIRH